MLNVPVDFSFGPTDTELIMEILFPRSTGQPYPPGKEVADIDLYGAKVNLWTSSTMCHGLIGTKRKEAALSVPSRTRLVPEETLVAERGKGRVQWKNYRIERKFCFLEDSSKPDRWVMHKFS